MKEDLRDLTQVRELGQVETLAEIIADRVGQLVSYSSLSRDIGASVDSIRRWTRTLESLYYCFSVRPWYKNVTRSLRKEPKYFLWDWSPVRDPGARAENLVASALLKAVHAWSDRGQDFGEGFRLRPSTPFSGTDRSRARLPGRHGRVLCGSELFR